MDTELRDRLTVIETKQEERWLAHNRQAEERYADWKKDFSDVKYDLTEIFKRLNKLNCGSHNAQIKAQWVIITLILVAVIKVAFF